MERSEHATLDNDQNQTLSSVVSGGGALMPPGALGRQVSASESFPPPPSPQVMAHPLTIRARQRTMQAILRSQRFNQSEGSFWASRDEEPVPSAMFSKLTALTYGGMEVLFGSAVQPQTTVYAMCSRTHLVFQTLDVSSTSPVIAMVSSPLSGQVVLGHADGSLQSYHPVPTAPQDASFGRYRWVSGPTFDCAKVFYEASSKASFMDATDAALGERLDVSLSGDFGILIAHQSQLAVLDASPTLPNSRERRMTAELLWTTNLPGKVATAKLSGDGDALAVVVVVESKDDQDADTDGVHTFERDWDDGSRSSPPVLVRSRSIGILYKPGPFLVHAAPVTRLAFRGLGHATSNVHNDHEQGGDLLLTYCGDNYSAKIFSQNSWKPLTEWTTPPRTRVDWIRGVSAFTLGDLESQKKHKTSAGPPSRLPSYNSLHEAENINATLGKRHHYQSIPSHATPSSNAGAWVAEISFPGDSPAIRLSRLTFLKRGMDELNPTIFENVSSFVPTGLVFENPVLSADDAVLSVEGIWPAWNPWLSETVETDAHNETLRGSAMAFLGLSSGPGVSGVGHFGDSLLGSTQSPPSELRLIASYPAVGKLVTLEFFLLGDNDWTALELGNPRKSILMLSDLHDAPRVELQDTADIAYESSRLVAQVAKKSRTISVSWRKNGTLSLLPSNWVPADAEPTKAVKLLKEKRWFQDDSLMPVPLALPLVSLPTLFPDDEHVVSMAWWPEDHFEAPPLLVALTSRGSIVVFELPPPWSLHEPIVLRSGEPSPTLPAGTHRGPPLTVSLAEEKTYNVAIVPHPEYGLGLRLEVQQDGMPAIAGSFKRHPLNGESLPAEKANLITLGDELISANGILLENKRFDDIIATVRDLGGACGPNDPMVLKFRRKARQQPWLSEQAGRRTMEEIIGIRSGTSDEQESRATDRAMFDDSAASLIVATFENVVDESLNPSHFSLVANEGPNDSARHPLQRSVTTFHASGKIVSVFHLSLNLSRAENKGKIQSLGSWENDDSVSSMDVERLDGNSFGLVVCNGTGVVSVVIASRELGESSSSSSLLFRRLDGFKLAESCGSNLLLRVNAINLVATMEKGPDELGEAITVWSASPRPGSTSPADDYADYAPSLIKADAADAFLDFAFVHTGYLDPCASIVSFSKTKATMFSRAGGSAEWLPTIQILYKTLPGSDPLASEYLPSKLKQQGLRPCNRFPHLLPALLLAYSSSDEREFLRSDWHPESLLSQIFIDDRGAQAALDYRIRYLLLWLCAEGSDIPEDCAEGPLLVAPIPLLHEKRTDDNKLTASDDYHSAALAAPVLIENDEVASLRKLRAVLSSRYAELDPKSSVPSPVAAASDLAQVDVTLPPILKSMSCEDVRILRACCDLLISPPDCKSIDQCGQHFLTAVSLLHNIWEGGESDRAHQQPQISFPASRVLLKSQAMQTDSPGGNVPAMASSACLAALLSSSQSLIIERCKRLGRPMDWTLAKELRLPFWVRSDEALARLAEEIGQSIFREKRDVMESAVFFIIARKTKTLRNLAATDRSDTGRLFFKFLTSHDFSSERGRRAAEKNAFSLLRKCRYRVAAAFFLLAEPPSLNSALETIATKSRDFDLAFLVARLMESKELDSANTGFGLSGLGGGGGYAAGPAELEPASLVEDQKFEDWKPAIGAAAQRLLIGRVLPATAHDCPLTCVQLLWLRKKEEASWCLSGIVHADGREKLFSTFPEIVGRTFGVNVQNGARKGPALLSVEKANALVDFVSAPSLLRAMNAGARVRFATALLVGTALAQKGVEVSSIEAILHYSDPFSEKEKDNMQSSHESATSGPPSADGQVQSSIFDSYDAPQPKRATAKPAAPPDTAQSSIFDSFDVHIAAPKAQAAPSIGMPQSSIFGSFDVPRPTSAPRPAPVPAPTATDQMQSSIFDSFDAPRPPKKAPPPVSSGAAQSSIFDSFDVPRPVAKQNAETVQMQSSIFDSFEVPAQVMKAAPPPAAQPSIFDAYDVQPASAGTPRTVGNGVNGVDAKPKAPAEEVPELALSIPSGSMPDLWLEWRKAYLEQAAARRLLREVASVLAQFDGDPSDPAIADFYQRDDPLVPSGASGILQLPCDSEHILGRVQQSLEELCAASSVEPTVVVHHALRLLGPEHQQHRTLFAVVVHAAAGRYELAEDTLRSAAFDLMQFCTSLAFSHDHLVHRRKTRSHVSTQFVRRRAARVSWQLETCLWLHRGGGLPLSGVALKEAVTAVRIGLLVASWNHNHECLEAMIRSDPDCRLDYEAGRHLWTSLKMIASAETGNSETKKTSSGGWEFLVDCRRSEATQMLREKRTGCFIIRPHTSDHSVFTLSFKTNLVPPPNDTREEDRTPDTSGDELSDSEGTSRRSRKKKSAKKDDVVQHAIIRLSESGYRCGSFGPYTTLISLLEAVSDSLPFNLRFDLPPSNRVIKEEGSQPSPNAVFLRKLALSHADSLVSSPPAPNESFSLSPSELERSDLRSNSIREKDRDNLMERQRCFGLFLELLVLSAVRKQLSSVVTADYNDVLEGSESDEEMECLSLGSGQNGGVSGSMMGMSNGKFDAQDRLAVAFRILKPLLTWCRVLEVQAGGELSPELKSLTHMVDHSPVDLAESSGAIEAAPHSGVCSIDGGDALLRRMIQRDSGVEFSTLRLVDGGECTIVVIFSQKDAIKWLVSSGLEETEEDALARLRRVEKHRVIEAIDLSRLPLKQKGAGNEDEGVRYRILDPWEVEALHSWEGETLGASLGRERFLGFNLGKVGLASENVFRSLGGLPLLALWTSTKGGVVLTKALATVHPPWERAAGGDMQFTNGAVTEPPPFENSIRQHLYRNALFRRLRMPQRFLALVQVELLDLKNLIAPGGSLSMSVYALLRLKREGSTAALTNKARTLDTAATHPVKLGKTSGPNAPASWGSVVRFRFPLPEHASVDGVSHDSDRELLFKGPPRVLQVSVYEKKLLVDYSLGTADIRTDGLWAGGQLEEWVPLRSEKHGISWFARIRLTLRFELMCLANEDESMDLASAAPSVGLRKIAELGRAGGAAHEDVKRSVSSPDLLTYFESMVY